MSAELTFNINIDTLVPIILFICAMHKLLSSRIDIFVHLHLSDTYENKIIGGRRNGTREQKKMAKFFIRYARESARIRNVAQNEEK